MNMVQIGIITSTRGLVTATKSTGESRVLNAGDPIFCNEIICSLYGPPLIKLTDEGSNALSVSQIGVQNPDYSLVAKEALPFTLPGQPLKTGTRLLQYWLSAEA